MHRQLILHVGHSKTGTTSIQKNLAAERTRLEEVGILFPETSIIPHNQRVLVRDIFYRGETGLSLRMEVASGNAMQMAHDEWRSVVDQFENSSAHTIVLSAEGFLQRQLDSSTGKRLRKRVDALACNAIRVISYMRSPTGYYISKAQQRLRGGFGLIRPEPLDRVLKIKAFHKFLGVDLEMRVFEKGQLVGGDVVRDFFDWIGQPDFCLENPVVDANTSVSAEAMSVLCNLKSARMYQNEKELKFQRRLVRLVKKHDAMLEAPTKPKLRPEISDYITRINADLVTLRDQYGLHFSDVDYCLAGAQLPGRAPKIDSVHDICAVNADRAAELQRRVSKELVKVKVSP